MYHLFSGASIESITTIIFFIVFPLKDPQVSFFFLAFDSKVTHATYLHYFATTYLNNIIRNASIIRGRLFFKEMRYIQSSFSSSDDFTGCFDLKWINAQALGSWRIVVGENFTNLAGSPKTITRFVVRVVTCGLENWSIWILHKNLGFKFHEASAHLLN